MHSDQGNSLTQKDLHLVRISLLGATGRLGELGKALEEASSDGVTSEEIKEALLEIYLFAGYPRAINALRTMHDTLGIEGSETEEVEGGDESEEDPVELERKGLELMELIYGRSLPSLLSNMKVLHADLARWMVREGYGKVLTRPGLSVKTRELCVVAILRALDCVPQLEAHMKGAVNAGARVEEIREALDLADALTQ
jgi:4-carboxymuconolactone decarboxylase